MEWNTWNNAYHKKYWSSSGKATTNELAKEEEEWREEEKEVEEGRGEGGEEIYFYKWKITINNEVEFFESCIIQKVK